MNTFSSLKSGVNPPKDIFVGSNSGNILFLDFDGVCNSFETGSYLTHEPDKYGIDPENVKRVRKICGSANARVVISSNWRKFGPHDSYAFTDKVYRNPLGQLYDKIGDLVIGTLTTERRLRKSEAVVLWLEDHPDFDGRFAIVDDDPREGFQDNRMLRRRFWLVDRRYGLTESVKREITSYLNGI